ncbi:stage V sporulation protein AD [Shimazuella sp. AN120528]|uniref:stage V sporulation protein AD n=1 Tax=Shimazuella soli TaxID=1892854 RepID=UPI001F0FE08A|nr:stage V sporulation protein AD [Shimazuella soli]MCH5583598.1 stage V sporulation protein AD [Shimazuella soli]
MIGRTWEFGPDTRVLASAAVGGPMESEGIIGKHLDHTFDDLYAGEDTWEKAERKMLSTAVDTAIQKSGKQQADIGVYLAGDLLNQNITASFSAQKLGIPFMGIYGACSSSMLSMTIGASFVNAGYTQYAIVGVSSHNCTAEKQYRYPTEYGGQKPDTAQWTVTGAGAAVVGKANTGPRVRYATIGKVMERGVKNPFDMGSAMAPAAVDTIISHFQDTGRKPADYDLIVTGDLASVGHPIARELLFQAGYDMGEQFSDCGLMIYNPDQETFAGGSGCASSAVVTYGKLMQEVAKGKLKRILVVATGALLSPVSYQQGENIPCIAHAVSFEND